MKTLRGMFLQELAETLDCEIQLKQLLPPLQRSCSSESLARVISLQKYETVHFTQRIERSFESFGEPVQRQPSVAVSGLVRIGPAPKGVRKLSANDLLQILLRLEHYKLATYCCLRDWAALLGNDFAAGLLHDNLSEARAVDSTLRNLARIEGLNPVLHLSNREALVPLCKVLTESERAVLHWLVEGMRSHQARPIHSTRSSLIVSLGRSLTSSGSTQDAQRLGTVHSTRPSLSPQCLPTVVVPEL